MDHFCQTQLFKTSATGSGNHFAYKTFRLQVDSPTLRSFRPHGLSRFAYIEVDSLLLNLNTYLKIDK